MDLKKIIAKEALGRILPMESDKPKLGRKAKVAGALATIAAIAGMASQFLGG